MTWSLNRESGPLGPYTDVRSVSPSDTVNLPQGVCQGVFATVAGNVAVQLTNGQTVTLPIAAGYSGKLEVLIARVLSTGTTATGIFALYV